MKSREFFCLAKVTPHNLLLCGGALIQVDAHSKFSTVALHKASLQLNGLSVTHTHSQHWKDAQHHQSSGKHKSKLLQ